MLGDRQSTAVRRIESSSRSRRANAQRYNAVTTPGDDSSRHRVTAASLHWMTVTLALLAGTIFVLADADGGRSRGSMWIQLSVEVALVISGTLIVRRRLAAGSETPLIMPLLVLVVVVPLLVPFLQFFLLPENQISFLALASRTPSAFNSF